LLQEGVKKFIDNLDLVARPIFAMTERAKRSQCRGPITAEVWPKSMGDELEVSRTEVADFIRVELLAV
jgi:hypothetical protein